MIRLSTSRWDMRQRDRYRKRPKTEGLHYFCWDGSGREVARGKKMCGGGAWGKIVKREKSAVVFGTNLIYSKYIWVAGNLNLPITETCCIFQTYHIIQISQLLKYAKYVPRFKPIAHGRPFVNQLSIVEICGGAHAHLATSLVHQVSTFLVVTFAK